MLIAATASFIPSPAIELVPKTNAPWVMLGVRMSVSRLGPTTNSVTGSAAFGAIACSDSDGAFARCVSGQVSSASRGT